MDVAETITSRRVTPEVEHSARRQLSAVAARVRAARPGVPVLYMSGYAQPVLDNQGALDPSFAHGCLCG